MENLFRYSSINSICRDQRTLILDVGNSAMALYRDFCLLRANLLATEATEIDCKLC